MSWVGKIAVVCLYGTLAFAQQDSSESVKVSYAYPKLTVSVTRPADLAVALEKLCKETQSNCEGIELARSSKLAPGTLRGTWNEVLDQLMEGSKLNYATSAPSATSRGALVVQGNKLVLPNPAPGMQNPQPMATEAGLETPPTTPASNDSAAPSENRDDSAQNMSMSVPAVSQSNNAVAMETATYQDSFKGTPRGGPFSPFPMESDALPRASFSPFPDSHGNLMPVSDEQPLYSPFPDSHGNLMPIAPGNISGSPFPIDLMRKADQQR
jgi:hypothetical protein